MKKNISCRYSQWQFNLQKISQADIDFLFNNEFNEINLPYISGSSLYSIWSQIERTAKSRIKNHSITILNPRHISDRQKGHSYYNDYICSKDIPIHIFVCLENKDGICIFDTQRGAGCSIPGYGIVPIQIPLESAILI